MSSTYIIALVVAVVIILIIVAILITKAKNKNKEPEASILDVDNIGVSDNHEFSYGYEKEATIVMDPVDPNKEIEESKTEVFIPEENNESEKSE
jgi:hypothetical protein